MVRPLRSIAFFLALGGLVACGDDPAPAAPSTSATTPPTSATTPPQPAQPSETDKLRAASAIGYDGDALQRSVDRVRAQAADQAKQVDEAARAANGSP